MHEYSELRSAGAVATWDWWLERYFGLLGHPEPHTAGPGIDRGRGLWTKALPGVSERLSAFREAGVRIAVISNSDGSVEESLTAAGLAAFFEVILDSAVVGASKPDPAIFAHACSVTSVEPDRCWYVGDSKFHDVGGAENAGFAAAWLVDPLGFGSGSMRVESVAALPDALG
jgi:putative hydrolase of the HAD superfamily